MRHTEAWDADVEVAHAPRMRYQKLRNPHEKRGRIRPLFLLCLLLPGLWVDYLQFGEDEFLPFMQNSTSFVRSSALK